MGNYDSTVFSFILLLLLGTTKSSAKLYCPENEKCDKMMFYFPQKFQEHGMGCQVNNYIMAVVISAFLDRPLRIVENEHINHFGCISDLDGNQDPTKPNGLSRLIKDEISDSLPNPCLKSLNYPILYNIAHNWTDIGRELFCKDGDQVTTSVIPFGGPTLRNFWRSHVAQNACEQPDWISRLGATKAEVEAAVMWSRSRKQGCTNFWNMVTGLLKRKGIPSFQPWFVRDAEALVTKVGMPSKYVAIHIRRGDKLWHESKRQVQNYWKRKGYTEETMPRNYVPFSYYLEQLDTSCTGSLDPVHVYLATDDMAEVRKEADAIDNSTTGRRFIFHYAETTAGIMHGHEPTNKLPCDQKYNIQVGILADLFLLSRSCYTVVSYNSNVGRLVRTMKSEVTSPLPSFNQSWSMSHEQLLHKVETIKDIFGRQSWDGSAIIG